MMHEEEGRLVTYGLTGHWLPVTRHIGFGSERDHQRSAASTSVVCGVALARHGPPNPRIRYMYVSDAIMSDIRIELVVFERQGQTELTTTTQGYESDLI
jgi:hypothetical protein